MDTWGSGSLDLPARATLRVPSGPVDCRHEPCGFVFFDGANQTIAESSALAFAPPPEVTFGPATGLLDGAPITVDGTNLVPGASYLVRHCEGFSCDAGQAVQAAGDGTLSTEVPAVQRFTAESGQHVYCRANCEVSFSGGDGFVAEHAYTMATGELQVTPDAGLSDGQEVEVTGSGLMPTYAGPLLWIFPTGGWSLTQCDRAVLDDPSLVGALTHCAVAPDTRAVTVSGSTFDTIPQVRATITKILGGTTDCTAAPGACVIGLVRFEQDASLSTHLAPLTFGG
jgi:hypothetical protein